MEVLHGIEVADPFRWLEDGASPATRAWARDEDRRTRRLLSQRPDRDRLLARVLALLSLGVASAPAIEGDVVFSLDRWGGRDQACLVTRPRDGLGPFEPTVVVDPVVRTGDPTAALDWYAPAPGGRLVAYGLSRSGDERSTLHVVERSDGARTSERPDEIPHTRAASVAWLPDASGFVYTRYAHGGDQDRHVFLHHLGQDWTDDEVIFDRLPDPTAWPDVAISRDGRRLLVHVALGWSRIDLHLLDRWTGRWTTAIEGLDCVTGVEFDDRRGRLVGHTTMGAPRGRVVAIDPEEPAPERWSTLVAEGEGVVESVTVAGDELLVVSTRSAVSFVEHRTADGALVDSIDLGGLSTVAGVAGADDEGIAVLAVTGFTRPGALVRWAETRAVEPWSGYGVGGVGATRVEQVRYPSTDGTVVPMFLVSPAARGTGAEPRPTLLTGYGGFAITMSPGFSPVGAAFVEAGGCFAVAGIRGGAEEGEEWHRAGMRERKQQVFDDFAAAADWLVATGVTTPERLAIRGGSNGGLLVAATITQRPDLCRAAVCDVPLTDMVRYHRFLLGPLWVPEYGDPEVAEDLAWLHAYSPYHHVAEGTCYPATLVTTGEEDSRVDPAHARKFAARLLAATSCGQDGAHPVLLRVEASAGHGQGKPVSKQAEELADVLAFLRWQLGPPVAGGR